MEDEEEQWARGAVITEVPPFEEDGAWDDKAILQVPLPHGFALHRMFEGLESPCRCYVPTTYPVHAYYV
jgi:hypothetical protein